MEVQILSRAFFMIVHRHLIYQAKVGRNDLGQDAQDTLQKFILDLVREIEMQVLIPPQFKFSHQKAWTGLVGIVTSHVSFHYWTVEQYVQLDIYSCKEFDRARTIEFLNDFWKATEVKSLFIDREVGKDFKIENL